jgi:hypothetical protein
MENWCVCVCVCVCAIDMFNFFLSVGLTVLGQWAKLLMFLKCVSILKRVSKLN